MSDSPEVFSVLLTSSARVAIVSASWLEVSTMASVSSCDASDHQIDDGERFLGEDFGDPVESRGHHVFEAGGDFGEFLADVIGLEIEARAESLARRGDRARGLRACRLQPIKRSPPRSPNCAIMLSPI